MTPHTPTQRVFLEAATPSQIAAFLSRGPAEVGQMLNIEQNQICYSAAIRGVRLGEETYPTSGEAMKVATDYLDAIKSGAKGPVAELDEEALGITGRNIDLHNAAAEPEAIVRFPVLMHIGIQIAQSDSVPAVFEDFFEELMEGEDWFLASLLPTLPWLASFDGHAYFEHSTRHREAIEEGWNDFCSAAWRNGTLGFLICAERPAGIKYHGDEMKSFSWGFTEQRWFYAETMEAAIAAGVAWAQRCEAKEIQESQA